MARKFAELESKMSPESIRRSDERFAELELELELSALRTKLDVTQESLAKRLRVNQAAVSKLERRDDMFVSTLADFVSALGGTLEILARFPQGRIKIKQPGARKRATGKQGKKVKTR